MADVQVFAPEEMKHAILDAARVFEQMSEEKELMKRHIIGQKRQFELAGRLFFENDAFGSTQLNIVNNEMRKPTYDYRATGSIWEIYQYVTYAMKELHPRLWMDAHVSVHKYFLEELGLHPVVEEPADVILTHPAEGTIILKLNPTQIDLLDSIKEVEQEKSIEDGNNT